MHDEVSETENIRKNLSIERQIVGGCEELLDVQQVFIRQGRPHLENTLLCNQDACCKVILFFIKLSLIESEGTLSDGFSVNLVSVAININENEVCVRQSISPRLRLH